MKKVLAILLAVTLLFSVMAVGFVAFAEGEGSTVTEQQGTAENTQTADNADDSTPTWLTNLINRLMEVLTKVLTKLGIKFALKTGALA